MARTNSIVAAIKLIEDKMPDIMNNIAEDVKLNSEALTPVVSGTLKRGYEIEKTNNINQPAVVVNKVPYSAFVEFGTSDFSGRRMMTQGAAQIPRNGNKYVK